MRTGRVLAAASAAALLGTSLTGAAAYAGATATTQEAGAASWLVLTEEGADVDAVAADLTSAGAAVVSVNDAIGLLTVTSSDATFADRAGTIAGVEGVATDQVIGATPHREAKPDAVERENLADRGDTRRHDGAGAKAPQAGQDPFDGLLWGKEMINAVEANQYELGDKRVTVGILDTGVDATHPDLRTNFDSRRSRNFTTDMTDVDGPCEYESCVDPADEDHNGHGTHVAGTIGAALNGIGVSGVAPEVTLVNIRGGQDSGYFFLGPVSEALTYAALTGIDVVNMSFYVDPWLYNCLGGAPEDSPEAASEQAVIIEVMNRALEFAHANGVTLVGALGNNHEDLSNPRNDFSSPDYPADAAYERTIDNASCYDLPVEGPHVLGISSLGPSTTKSDFSNYATDLTSDEIELSAPGGWFRDGFGTPSYRTNENMILSTVSLVSLTDTGEVDENGNITPVGEANGVMKQCDAQDRCGYYAWYQGTSMAAPHASGVAALAVSAHGSMDHLGWRGLTLEPDSVRSLMMDSATDTACTTDVQSYVREGRSAEFDAPCVGTADFNSFYGDGIVNALGVVKTSR